MRNIIFNFQSLAIPNNLTYHHFFDYKIIWEFFQFYEFCQHLNLKCLFRKINPMYL